MIHGKNQSNESNTSLIHTHTQPLQEYGEKRPKRGNRPTARRGKPFIRPGNSTPFVHTKLNIVPSYTSLNKGTIGFDPTFLEAMMYSDKNKQYESSQPLSNMPILDNSMSVNTLRPNDQDKVFTHPPAWFDSLPNQQVQQQTDDADVGSSSYTHQTNTNMNSYIQNDVFNGPKVADQGYTKKKSHDSPLFPKVVPISAFGQSPIQQQQIKDPSFPVQPQVSRWNCIQVNASPFYESLHGYTVMICPEKAMRNRFKKPRTRRVVPYPIKRRRCLNIKKQ